MNKILLVSLCGAAVLLSSCDVSTSEPPRRFGPPALVQVGDEAQLWVLVKQEERKQRRVGGSRYSMGNVVTEVLHHFDLQSHDTRTAAKLWKKRLLSVKSDDGGSTATARILGQDGDAVWLFVHDQPVAVSSRDGQVLANRRTLEERNPALQGLVSKELTFYTFDDGLVLTAADAKRHKIKASDFTAEPYRPTSEEEFNNLQMLSTRWNGSFPTSDFLTRMAWVGGRWLGLYTEKEAADAGNDTFGDRLTDPTRVLHEGSRARRTFWTARIGKTKEFTEGSHDRLFDVTRVPGAPEFLEAGLLLRPGGKDPLVIKEGDGLLVLHRTRLDGEGRLAVTRLDENLRETWKTKLPFLELGNRYEFPDRLLTYGSLQVTEKGVTRWEEAIAAVSLRDGNTQAWNVTLDREVVPADFEKSGSK